MLKSAFIGVTFLAHYSLIDSYYSLTDSYSLMIHIHLILKSAFIGMVTLPAHYSLIHIIHLLI